MSADDSSGEDRTVPFFMLSKDTMVSHYRIIEKVGAGGMGEVYSAQDTKLNRQVALKFLSPHLSNDPTCRRRFAMEAQAVAGLDHPNILTVYEIGEFQGRPYFSMQYQSGSSLDQVLSSGEIPFRQALDIVVQICEGLGEAHDKGVIHRDLKPANIIISPRGRVRIVDFGLAKILTDSVRAQSGSMVGTVNYMSPEQVDGKVVDQRTDIFAVGVLFYELLAGVNPFDRGSASATLRSIALENPEALYHYRHTIPGECQAVIDKALAKNPDDRYQGVRGFLADLKLLQAKYLPHLSEGMLGLSVLSPPVQDSQSSIAVLPFVNLSPDPDNEYFADGLTEELLNVLTKIEHLRVAARTSSFVFKNHQEDVREIGRKLSVDSILEGSVRKSGDRMRITVQLVQVSDGYHLWSETYDRTSGDILAMQDEIARSVLERLRTTLSGPRGESATATAVEADIQRAVKGRGVNVEAHQLYLRGQHLVERLTREDVSKALECFQKAVDLDPQYALAWAGISRAYADQAGHGWIPIAEGFGRSRAAAERALEIEPNLAEGFMRLGLIRMSYDWDWKGALQAVKRALELAPGRTSVLRSAAHLASNLNQLDEAISLSRRVVVLDPLSPTAFHSLGIYCYSADRLQEADTALKTALELNPRQTGLRLDCARVHLALGLRDQALTDAQEEEFEPFRLLGLSLAYHARGETDKSQAAVEQLTEKYGDDGAYQIAEARAFRGEVDTAFKWLERAFEQRDPGLPEMRAEPLLRVMHSDRRWQLFMERLGFTSDL